MASQVRSSPSKRRVSAVAATKVAATVVNPPRERVPLALPRELGRAVGFNIRRAVSVADAIFAEVFNELEISTQQYAILLSVGHNPGCQTSQLSALLNITPNNIVPQIDSLEARGLIKRSSIARDRRIRQLRLTAAGEKFAAELVRRHEAVRERVEARLGAKDAAELLRLLVKYGDCVR